MYACMYINVCMHNVHEILQNRREPYRTQVMTSFAIPPCCTILELLERNTFMVGAMTNTPRTHTVTVKNHVIKPSNSY